MRTQAELLKVLADLMPSVAISVYREFDRDAVWDGDGPDPTDQGYNPYVVVVRAIAIVNGQFIEGTQHLSSSYYKLDEPIEMAHGYLPQLIVEALADLATHAKGHYDLQQSIKIGKQFTEGCARGAAFLKHCVHDAIEEES